MRTRYDEELKQLDALLKQMAEDVIHAVEQAMQALMNQDIALAQAICDYDIQINQQEKQIQDLCFSLILKQQPVASDLKHISSILKVITDLERIADHAADISQLVKEVHHLLDISLYSQMEKMSKSTIYMLEQAIYAFEKSDLLLANQIWEFDDVIDQMYDVIKQRGIECLKQQPEQAEKIVNDLLVAKYLEKMGDHAQNVVEWILYTKE